MSTQNPRSDSVQLLVLEKIVTIWKRKWLALAVAWLVCLTGWAGVMLLPQRFESDARAFVDVNGLLTPLLKGLIVDTTPAETEGYLRQTLLSRPNLEQVIVLANLDNPNATEIQHEKLLDELATDIKVKADENKLVSISYVNRNPLVAKSVVDALLTVFAEKAAGSSRVEMEKARAFLNQQIAQYQAQLRSAEQRRADFRKKYANYFVDTGVAHPDLLKQQVDQLRQQYSDATLMRNAIAAEMAHVPQLLSVTSAPAVSNSGQIVVASPETRLAQAKRNLADLQLLYTDKHPDVIAAKRSVEELQADIEAQKKTGGSDEGKTEISNPAYEQLRLKLADADAAIPPLKDRVAKAEADFGRAKSLSATLPDVEAKSQDIDRDYTIIKSNYDELVKRREATNLSQAADDRADRTQFRVVDPPQVPIFPSFPDRFALFSLATLLGIAAGVAAPIVVSQVYPTFDSPASLRELGLPVFGSISFVRGAQPQTLFERASWGMFAGATGTLFVVYGGLLVAATGISHGVW